MAAIWDWYDDAYFFFFPVPTVLRCFCGSMLPETASSATATHRLLVIHDLDERLADLHGQLFAVFIEEHVLAVLEQGHVGMHTAAINAEDGLGHEGCGAAFFNGSVADDVFCYHGVVCHFDNIIKLNLDFKLAGAADFVVMILDFNAPIFHKHAYFAGGDCNYLSCGAPM